MVLGGTRAKVIALPKRPLQCFRCLELGHVGAACVSPLERAHLCFRCGECGHKARDCMAAAPRCPICESRGVPAKHRMGSEACRPPKATGRNLRRLVAGRAALARKGTKASVGAVTEAMAEAKIAGPTAAIESSTSRVSGLGEAMEVTE